MIYDKESAIEFVLKMQEYTNCLDAELLKLREIFEEIDEWKDSQKKIFENGLSDICQELDTIVKTQDEYVDIFIAKIQSLDR